MNDEEEDEDNDEDDDEDDKAGEGAEADWVEDVVVDDVDAKEGMVDGGVAGNG